MLHEDRHSKVGDADPRATRKQPNLTELLAFEAPYVVRKLLDNGTVRSAQDGERLFQEVKRFLYLANEPGSKGSMFSSNVDEGWHQFVLYTAEYSAFCKQFFGRYIHHAPTVKDESSKAERMTFHEFAVAYREAFGMNLPEVWLDESALRLDRRVVVRQAEIPYQVRTSNDKSMLVQESPAGEQVRIRIDAWGERALRFMLDRSVFYVRELPGLDDEDKLELCRVLMRTGILRLC